MLADTTPHQEFGSQSQLLTQSSSSRILAYSNDMFTTLNSRSLSDVHEAIEISNDVELANVAVSGNGTKDNPYILEDWNIITSGVHGIYIHHTTTYFIIRNCWISTGYVNMIHGIFIEEVDDGTARISNCTTEKNDYGICILNSPSTIMANNTCQENNYGIRVMSSSYSMIYWNMIIENQKYGIHLDAGTSYVILHHNFFINNAYQAFDQYDGNQWYDNSTNEGNAWSDHQGTGAYEIYGGFNSRDPYPILLDSDGDEMVDWWEIQAGLDPSDVNDGFLDLDSDGMSNAWEIINKLDPSDPSDATGDPDGDWVVNLDEYIGNSDPHDAWSFPLFSTSVYHVTMGFIIVVTSLVIVTAIIYRSKVRKSMITRLKAPDYNIALKTQKRGFIDYLAYERAKNDAKEYLEEGNEAHSSGDHESAIQHYEIALSLFKRLGSDLMVAETVFIIASVLKEEQTLSVDSSILNHFPPPPHDDPVIKTLHEMLQLLQAENNSD
jgi:parallel beta-helix repeat protein